MIPLLSESRFNLSLINCTRRFIYIPFDRGTVGWETMQSFLTRFDGKSVQAGDAETQFQLRFTVSRGTKDEDMKAGLHRTAEGKWTVTSSATAA